MCPLLALYPTARDVIASTDSSSSGFATMMFYPDPPFASTLRIRDHWNAWTPWGLLTLRKPFVLFISYPVFPMVTSWSPRYTHGRGMGSNRIDGIRITSTSKWSSDDASRTCAYLGTRFVDRDMYMRYQWGMSVGHSYMYPKFPPPSIPTIGPDFDHCMGDGQAQTEGISFAKEMSSFLMYFC